MDVDTVLVYLELKLADTMELLGKQKGKQKPGEGTSFEEALQCNAAELQATITTYKDQRMAQSISRAIQDDAPALANEIAQAAQAERDRATALALSGEPALTRRGSSASTSDIPSGATMKRLMPLNIFKDNDTCSLVGDDVSITNGEGPSRFGTRECMACNTEKPIRQIYTAPCAHNYCHACVIRLFENSLVDKSLSLPRCCRQDMPLSSVRSRLGPELTQRIELKAIEQNTANKNYCSNKACSAFILPTDVTNDRGRCSACGTETCVQCKEVAHAGNCEQAMDEPVLRLAEEHGWRRCYSCHALVELYTGCNHIT